MTAPKLDRQMVRSSDGVDHHQPVLLQTTVRGSAVGTKQAEGLSAWVR